MSVYIKGDKISKVYFGGDNIVKIYKGRDLVFGGDGGGDDGYWFKATTTKDLSTYNVICNSIYSNNAFIGTVYPTSALTQGTYKFNEDNIKNGSGSFDNYIGISLSDGATTPTYAPISYIKFLPSYTEKFNTIGTFKKNTNITSVDMSDITLTGLKSMLDFFYMCENLQSVNLSNFSAPNLLNMSNLFPLCAKLTSINFKGINVPNVTDISHLLSFLNEIEEVDLSDLQVKPNYSANYLVYSTPKLKSLNVSSIDATNITGFNYVFSQAPLLSNLILGEGWGKSTASSLNLDLSKINGDNNYQFTDATWESMLTMYDRTTNGLPTMTIKINSASNYPDGWISKMSARGYTISFA